MRKSGFTLIELIFVIVIIGVLAATAIPKFKNLKQSAEGKNIVKLVKDVESSLPSAYVNKVDLEEEAKPTKLNEVVSITGKGWTGTNTLEATFAQTSGAIATITLDTTARTLVTSIDCDNFLDTGSQAKCHDAAGTTSGTTLDGNVSF